MTLDRDGLEELVSEYIARCESGERLDPERFASEHPEAGPELLEALRRVSATEAMFPATLRDLPAQLGPFVVRREIGRGGMGRVLEVEHRDRPGETTALKLLTASAAHNPRAIERLRREGEILQRIAHPGIVRVHEIGVVDGTPFVRIDLIDGDSLATRIAAARAQSEGGTRAAPASERLALPGEGSGAVRVARVVARVARAVAVAHAAGLLHRDIKPGNVILDRAGEPVLIDFGLAADESGPTLTRTGDVLGTPHYMAPEQAAGGRATERCDVYGLGALLYELVTLRPPHAGSDSVQVLFAVRSLPVPPLRRAEPRAPAALATIAHRALAFDPRHRYATAAALAQDLEAFAEGRPITARPPGAGERLADLWRFRRRRVAAIAAALVIATLAILLATRTDRDREARARAVVDRASIAWIDGDDAAVAAAGRELARIDPDHALAVVLVALGEHEDPAGHAGPAGQAGPDRVGPDREGPDHEDPAMRDLAEGVRRLRGGEPALAIDPLRRAADGMPGSSLPIVLHARAAQQARRLDVAEEAFAVAVRMLPGSNTLRRDLAAVYRDRDRHDDAAQVLRTALAHDDRDAQTWLDLARTEHARKDSAAGLEALEQALARIDGRPDDGALRLHGKLLEGLKRFDEAEAVFRDLIARNPTRRGYRNDLTMCLDWSHRVFEARDAYREWIAALPRDPLGPILLAFMLCGARREECTECDAFYDAHPDFLDFDEAERLTLRALELDRGADVRVAGTAQLVALRIGRRDAITAAIRKLLDEAHAKGDDDVILRLSKVLRSLTQD